MYGLLYPGVLGTGIVLTAVRAAHDDSVSQALLDPSIHVSVTACMFFMASFVSAFYWPPPAAHAVQPHRYSGSAFTCDLVEIVLMFICFHFLGLFELPTIIEPNLLCAYLVLAADVLLQFIWRKSAHIKEWNRMWKLRCSVAVVMVLGAFFGKASPTVTILIALFVLAFVVYYVAKDPRYHGRA
jgi:hypothetical protein